MNLQKTEQAILATIFVDRGAIGVIKAELTPDKFTCGPGADKFDKAHKYIYQSMVRINGRIDVLSVSNELGDDLEKAGGAAYLQYLATACLPQLGIRSTESLPQWVRTVDAAGRLYQVGELVDEYNNLYSDFYALLDRIEDVDTFIADFQEKLSAVALGSAGIKYEHISTANARYRMVLEDEANGKILSFFPSGWPSFDKFGLPPQAALMVISGLSSMGKSQLMLQLALGVAIQLKANDHPGVVVINTYEMSGWRCARRLAASLAAVDYQCAGARTTGSKEFNALHNALDFVDTLPIYYDTSMTTSQIAMQCTRLATQGKPVIFVGVDYAEEVPSEGKEHSEELRVSNVFRGAKRLAVAMDACSCVLSQVSDISSYTNGIIPYNKLRYSRGATNAADVVGYVYNPPQMRLMRIPFTFEESLGDEGYAYLIVQKNRDGKIGSFPLDWSSDCARFKDPAFTRMGAPLYSNLEKLGFVKGEFIVEDF